MDYFLYGRLTHPKRLPKEHYKVGNEGHAYNGGSQKLQWATAL